MAVVLIQQMPEGFRAEMYDSVNSKLGLEDDPPAGLIAHAAGADDGGQWRVVEVWESREAHERFVEERLWPRIAEQIRAMGEDPDQAPTPERLFFDAHHVALNAEAAAR